MNSFCHKMLRTLKLTKAVFFVVFSLHLFSLSVTDQDVCLFNSWLETSVGYSDRVVFK